MSNTQKKTSKAFIVHSLIGVLIMVGFRYLPISLPEVTEVGIEIIGIFIGTLYLWTTVDPLWGSLISIGLIGLSGYSSMNQVLAECFGSPVVVQVLFLMIIVGALIENKITLYIGRFFLTRKVVEGRPWVFTFVLMLGTFLMSAFVSPWAPIFLFWPVLYDIFAEIGYTRDDTYPKIMIVFVVMATLLGFPVPPFMNNGLALLSNYRNITNNTVYINDALYMILTIATNLVMMIAMVLFAKYILKPDVSKVKEIKVDMLKRNPLPKMDLKQKTLVAGFVVLIILFLAPTLCPDIALCQTIQKSSYGLALLVVGALSAIKIEGKPLMDYPAIMGKHVGWSSYFLVACAILIGNVITNDATGITQFLNFVLAPLFGGMSVLTFTIFVLLVAVIFTNLCNSLVIGMILQPIISSYCLTTGANAAPIVCVMISFVLASAACTPAASPFATILHGNTTWLKASETYKYTLLFVGIMLVIQLVVGLPLANLLMT